MPPLTKKAGKQTSRKAFSSSTTRAFSAPRSIRISSKARPSLVSLAQNAVATPTRQLHRERTPGSRYSLLGPPVFCVTFTPPPRRLNPSIEARNEAFRARTPPVRDGGNGTKDYLYP